MFLSYLRPLLIIGNEAEIKHISPKKKIINKMLECVAMHKYLCTLFLTAIACKYFRPPFSTCSLHKKYWQINETYYFKIFREFLMKYNCIHEI